MNGFDHFDYTHLRYLLRAIEGKHPPSDGAPMAYDEWAKKTAQAIRSEMTIRPSQEVYLKDAKVAK